MKRRKTRRVRRNAEDGRKQLIYTMNYVEVEMPYRAMIDLSSGGRVDDSADYWARNHNVKIYGTPEKVRKELKEYGAWSAEELMDDEANIRRLLWVTAGNMRENPELVEEVKK